MRDAEPRCQNVWIVVGEASIARHTIIISIEDIATFKVVGSSGPVPVRHCAFEPALLAQVFLEEMNIHSVPWQEKAIKMYDTCLINVDYSPVKETIDGCWILDGVQVGWFGSQTVNGVCESLAICWWHDIKIIAHACILRVALPLMAALMAVPIMPIRRRWC